MQKLLSKMRQAINDFNLIENGDKIAIGLSGGKDSLALLYLLSKYQKFAPEKFELIAITLNPGSVDNSPLYELCKNLNIEFKEIQSDIKNIVFNIRKEKNPCALCAKLRKYWHISSNTFCAFCLLVVAILAKLLIEEVCSTNTV